MEFILKIFEIILHIDVYLDVIIKSFGEWIYLILFIIIFMETGFVITPFLPGDSLLFACGTFAAVGILSPVKTFVVIVVAAIIGDGVNYHIGKFVGKSFFERYPKIFRKEYIEKTHKFYERYGSKTIVLARFVPIVRTFAPFMAGLGYMTYSVFIIYNIAGSFLWAFIVYLGGYFFGNIPVVKDNFSLVIISIIIVSIIPIITELIKGKK
ncbi:MAG: DedA family protein [Elusimicrobiota bacterium]